MYQDSFKQVDEKYKNIYLRGTQYEMINYSSNI